MPANNRDMAFKAACKQALSIPISAQTTHAFHNKATTIMGLKFANRLGIAAGFDKQGELGKTAGALGFGHIELGTHTFEQCTSLTIKNAPADCKPALIGINLNIHEVLKDEINIKIRTHLKKINNIADYISINLYDHYNEEALQHVIRNISELKKYQLHFSTDTNKILPLIIKLHTNPQADNLKATISTLQSLSVSGIAISFDLGKPVTKNTFLFWQDPLAQAHVCRQLEHYRKLIHENTALIAIGGVSQAQHYQDRLSAGADLIQLHNALVFNGPDTAYKILKET